MAHGNYMIQVIYRNEVLVSYSASTHPQIGEEIFDVSGIYEVKRILHKIEEYKDGGESYLDFVKIFVE